MDTQKVIPFLIVISAALLLFDVYFLARWTNFVKKKGWSKNVYRVAWIVGGLMIVAGYHTLRIRFLNLFPNDFDKFVFYLFYIWYLPKILLAPILFIIDIFRGAIHLWKNIFNRPFRARSAIPVSQDRRRILQSIGWGAASLPFAIAARGMVDTTYDYRVYRENIFVNNLPEALEGLKIVQLSDIHAGNFFSPEPFRRAVSIVASLRADIIFITGDFVNFHWRELEFLAEDFAKIDAKFGVYGCLGNHDHYASLAAFEVLKRKIADLGVRLLVNENETLNIRGEDLQLAGVDNTSYRHNYGDFDKALAGLDPTRPQFLLCHDPTNWDRFVRGKTAVDVMFAGHTHGGQIGFDFGGRNIYTPARFVYKQWAGLYRDGGQSLYVNRGLGATGAPIRIGVEPEISELILRRKVV